MADRTLVWTIEKSEGNPTHMMPAYYMEAEYEPVAVRIYAHTAPVTSATFEIYDDGVSIMNDSAWNYAAYRANTQAYSEVRTIELPAGANSDEMAEDFSETPIEAGSWVTCSLTNDGGARKITVLMDLERISEGNEDE